MKRYLPFAIIALVLVVAAVAGTWMFRSTQSETPTPPPLASATPATSQTTGVPKGTVTIEEYGDYQCPPCGSLHPEIKKLKGEFGDRIRLVFYQFPLTQIHKHALMASQAASAARLQGKFWEMHDLLYENQKAWSEAEDIRPIVLSFARTLRLDGDRFARDLDSLDVATAISADMRRGESFGVNGTPTLFIDGQLIENENMTTEKLRNIINQKLAGH